MINVETKSGFTCSLEPEVLNDWELLEALCEIDNGNSAAIVKIPARLLSKDDQKALKEHCRGDNGRIACDRMVLEITEILNAVKQGKNS